MVTPLEINVAAHPEIQRCPLVLVTDVHLRQPDDERGRLLLGLVIAMQKSRPDHFVLLGDIFDFCLGSGAFFQSKFRQLGEELQKLASLGTRVIFLEGNHEFEMDNLGWTGVECHDLADVVITLRGGQRVGLCHGDLLYATWDYRWFRAFLKSRFVRTMARLLPGRWLDAYALYHAKTSRGQDQYRKLNHRAVMTGARQWMRRRNLDFGLFGHFHVPYAEPRDGENATRLLVSCPSWDRPNFLAFTENGMKRFILKRGDERNDANRGYIALLGKTEPLFPEIS